MRSAIVVMMMGMTASAAADSSVTAMAPARDGGPTLGVMTDIGIPDGATASLAARPIRALRVELGVAEDGVGPGVRGGVTWIPLSSWATPTLGVSYGRFFERDANPLARTISGDSTFSSPLLDRVGYDFASARAGIELGRRHVTFFIHAGVSAVTAQLHNLDMVANNPGSMVTVSTTDPHIRLVSVSANLGFVVYLF